MGPDRTVGGGPRADVSPSGASQVPLELADQLARLGFHLAGDQRADLTARRDRMVGVICGVHDRLAESDAPLLAVVGGGTGAGKTTTVNTLAGRTVATPGVLRPTTRVPTLVCRPDDLHWFERDRLLPDLVRVHIATDAAVGPDADATRAEAEARTEADPRGTDDSGRQLRIATSDGLPPGIALLDTPDIDSVETRNHAMAEAALDVADVWVWLATVRTYSDQVGMDHLLLAQARRAATAVAITQARDEQRAEVEPDVDRLLASAGVSPDLRVVIPFAEVEDGRLPPDTVTELRDWLTALASGPKERRNVRDRALNGLRAAIPHELAPLLDAAEAEVRAVRGLQALVATRFGAVADGLDRDLDVGLPLRSEVVDTWQELVRGNDALLRVQTAAGRLGDLVRSRLRMPSTDDADEVRVEVASELTTSISLLLEQAHRAVRHGLEERPEGRALLDHRDELRHELSDPRPAVRRTVADWEERVSALVEEVGAPGKARAKRWSTGLNAVATSAILVVFTLSGGLTGGEVGIAAGAAAANQWLLTRLLGEQNVRRLLAAVREELFERVDALAADERRRYEAAIDDAAPPPDVVEVLRRTVGASR